MDVFDQKQSSHQWANYKGLIRKCIKHGIEYDPHIFENCPKCIKEEKTKRLKEAFDRVIWPEI